MLYCYRIRQQFIEYDKLYRFSPANTKGVNNMKNLKVKLTFIEGVLGTAPNNPELYRDFIASKAPDASTIDDEVAAIGVDGIVEKSLTVFPRNQDGQPIFYDYQIKGLFKDACGSLRKVTDSESAKIKAYKKEIDGLIFVSPRMIPIITKDEIGICQRPLRAQTAQGERVSLAISEEIKAGASIEFTVSCLSDAHEKAVREWLDYGALRGLGQWRNSGKGRFVWEEV